jgi:hypothetical protein
MRVRRTPKGHSRKTRTKSKLRTGVLVCCEFVMWGKRRTLEDPGRVGTDSTATLVAASAGKDDVGPTLPPRNGQREAFGYAAPATAQTTAQQTASTPRERTGSDQRTQSNLADRSQDTPAAAATPAAAQSTADQLLFAAIFRRIVPVLTWSDHHKHGALSDCELLVAPPMLSGQSH